ncbi:MAG: amine dehydrogenase [Burkholderiales bacterium PBB5]|nr:MAG: amine dehydrogenase [Burkholderiales bacterium PBB5]
MKRLFDFIDGFTERRARALASTTSRRSALLKVSRLMVASAFTLPVLPFDWRYCSVDGFLCSCCGGSATTCPPGTSPSKVTWVGTCHNPADGKDYLVSYNDCCGKTSCGRCFCNTNHGDRPGYRMGVHNDVNWCMANDSSVYHCTVSIIVGVAEKD